MKVMGKVWGSSAILNFPLFEPKESMVSPGLALKLDAHFFFVFNNFDIKVRMIIKIRVLK